MVKLKELSTTEEVTADLLRDPEARQEYDRTAFANAVAIRVIRYRTERGLSQTALARQLDMSQPAIARLEAGDHEPSLTMLARLAQGLGVDFSIEITPDAVQLRALRAAQLRALRAAASKKADARRTTRGARVSA